MTGEYLIKFIEENNLQDYEFIMSENYGEGEYPISNLYIDENSKTVEVTI